MGGDLNKRPGGSVSVTKCALEVSCIETSYTNRRLCIFYLMFNPGHFLKLDLRSQDSLTVCHEILHGDRKL